MGQMYYEFEIRKEIKRLEWLRNKFNEKTNSWNRFNDRMDQLKWVLGE